MLQLMLTKSVWDGWKWAIFSPENYPANDFYDDLVEMYLGKWTTNMTEEEYTKACKFIGEHIFLINLIQCKGHIKEKTNIYQAYLRI